MSWLHILAPLATLVVTSATTSGGVGGAFILVPLFYWLGLPMYEAEMLGLFMAFFSASSACVNFRRGGHLKFKMAAALFAGMVVCSPLGSYASATVNRSVLLGVFFVFLLAAGSLMLCYRPRTRAQGEDGDRGKRAYLLGVLAGALIGFLSGLLGIGGGILVGPFLLLQGFAAKDISGTSSFFVVLSTIVGFLAHLDFMSYTHINIDPLLFGLVLGAALIGGGVGSHLARFKLSASHIRRVIGGLQYVMAIVILLELVKALLRT